MEVFVDHILGVEVLSAHQNDLAIGCYGWAILAKSTIPSTFNLVSKTLDMILSILYLI